MGFTPLEGLVMGTRVGDIDPGAVIHLGQKLKLSSEKLESYLYRECGLLGISGKSNDIRDLLKLESEGDVRAELALEVFVYRIKKYIGSYFATLNGLDMLVFSGGIGERSPVIRSRICGNIGALGVVLDEDKNAGAVSADAFIGKEGASAKVAVIVTDEMGEIAREAGNIVQ